MNISDFEMLPGSKARTSVRLQKAKTVRELRLERVQLETENQEMEKKLQQLQSNMSREKEERKRSSAYHWRSGQPGPMTIQAQVLSQSKGKNNKVSSGKVTLQILKEQVQEPLKEPVKHEMANAVPQGKPKGKGMACGLGEIKSAQLTEADTHIGKLEVVDHVIKKVNNNELKVNHKQKKVNYKHQIIPVKFSSLLASVDTAKEPSSESTCPGLVKQYKRLLLDGTFNEKESAKSFQEALLQWRKGSCDHREPLHVGEVSSESVGICEVQTNLTVMKEPIQIEFKKDGLNYLEKLLLKKYRRTPIDQISGSCIKDLRPERTPNVQQAVTGGRGEGSDDDEDVINDLTVEEVKRYWRSVFREEVPNTISESAESSLKIEFLDDDLKESCDFMRMEAGDLEMDQQGKAEPRQKFARNLVSSEEVYKEKNAACSHPDRNAVEKESVKLKAVRRSLVSCEVPEKFSNPTELMSSTYLHETQLQKANEDSQEMDSVCNSLVLPVVTKSLVLQDVATRQKSIFTQYLGLEGFFAVGVNPKQVRLEVPSSQSADSSPVDSNTPFPGGKKWVPERSLSGYADDSVVQSVLQSQLNRPSSGFDTQSRTSPLMAVCRSNPGNESRRPWSTNTLHSKRTENCPRPMSSPMSVFRGESELPKQKYLDVTEDEYLWEYIADQEALSNLEKELQSCAGPEKCYSFTFEVVASSSRHLEKMGRNTTAFHPDLELKDLSGANTLAGWDESQMDHEEEILEDKQQVLALQ